MSDWDVGAVARRWWRSMNLSHEELRKLNIPPAGSGQKAVLRRCGTIEAACMTEGFRALWQLVPMNENGFKRVPIEVCAAIASVLSQVKSDEAGLSLARASGKAEKDRVPVSEMRFARLQSARTLDELVTRLRRLLPLIGSKVDVARLAQDISTWYWQKNAKRSIEPSRRIEMRWAMEYYGANDKQLTSQEGEA